MIGSNVLDRPEKRIGFDGGGGGLPPVTALGGPDFGDRRDWEAWESDLSSVDEIVAHEMELAAAVTRHPSGKGADEVMLTQALLNDGWRERHERQRQLVEGMNLLGDNVVIFRDVFPVHGSDTPPAA